MRQSRSWRRRSPSSAAPAGVRRRPSRSPISGGSPSRATRRSARPTLCEEALGIARELGDERALSAALNNLGEVRSAQGEHEQAIAHKEEVVALRRTLDDPLLVSNAMLNLGYAAFLSGDFERARPALEEALTIARAVEDALHIASALFLIGEIDLLAGDPATAETRIRESLALYTELGSDRDRADCMVVLAGIATANGAFDEAARLLGASDALRGAAPLDPFELKVLERFEAELEDALGERFGLLRSEGARAGVRRARLACCNRHRPALVSSNRDEFGATGEEGQ